jgi:glycosyltransferase involved in cell wall biosynthesis
MRPTRILHVIGAMNFGGIETWLMHVLEHTDRQRFQIDFLVHTDDSAAYDQRILALGSRILRCPHTGNPLLYARRFLTLLANHGPFDAVHSHVHHFSGIILMLARLMGIPERIAHSHSDTLETSRQAGVLRRTYFSAMVKLLLATCTRGFAVSELSAKALFGERWRQDRRLSVLYCGIDLETFRHAIDRPALRTELRLSLDDVVFGHVGRFSAVKNHFFFLDVAAHLLRRQPRAKFLLVGDGPLRPEVERRVAALGLANRFVFTGVRSDVPALMMNVMDVFLMPSLHEGIPLVLMEAQAAALPCLVSDVITAEAIVNPALLKLLPLSAGPDEWARVACEAANTSRFDRAEALDLIASSRFNIHRGIDQMCDIYLGHSAINPLRPASAVRGTQYD